ncbi:MAG: hypothetical protein LBM93_13675 [Oscillospiraceae bacterium]|jgi:hypothetical protein|nr:hypothetical protein [Oscillospiraceae bacterium]
MINIKTYIKNSLYKKNHLTEFVDLQKSNEIAIFAKKIDPEYIEGAIVINYYEEILGLGYWDYIVPTWQFWIDAIDEYLIKNHSIVNFPDQPAKIILKRIYNDILGIKIDNSDRKIEIKEFDFFNSMLDSAVYFFKEIEKYFSVSTGIYLVKAYELKAKIQ